MKKQKTIGILGGMGPYTTIDFFKKLVDFTPAKKDWEHLRIIIDNNPKIPSRSRAILYGENSPEPGMVETAKNLEKAGADFIVIPCNTAHIFIDAVKKSVTIPVLDIVEETFKEIMKVSPQTKKIGLLATAVMANSGIYERIFSQNGKIKIIKPNKSGQDVISEAIEAVKINEQNIGIIESVIKIINNLINEGIDSIILGCTELSILLKTVELKVPAFDSSEILAKKTVSVARGEE